MAKKPAVAKLHDNGLPKQAAPVMMGVGAVALLAGLWLLWSAMSVDEAGPADNAARTSIDRIGDAISQINQALASPQVLETARQALAGGDADTETVRRQLQSAGVPNLLDVRVFPPSVEDIEVGEYPEPDFTVVQMLLSARRQGTAPAEVHYPGTANENLAFAQSIPAAGEDSALAGYLFIRLPVSVVTRRLAQPAAEGWLALQQGETVIASNGRLAAERVPDGQATIAGSHLRLSWTTASAAGGSSPTLGGAVATVGLLLLIGGFVVKQRAGAPVEEAQADRPAQAEAPDEEAAPRRGGASAAAGSAAAAEGDRQELPDWMLDEPAAGGPFAKAEEAERKRSRADVPFDVPDLDEIYEQLESEEDETAAGGAKQDEDESGRPAASEKSSEELTDASDDDLLSDGEGFDFAEDTIEPDEADLPEPGRDFDEDDESRSDEHAEGDKADQAPKEEEKEEDEEKAEEKETGLDLDFAFSDAADRRGQEANDAAADAGAESSAEADEAVSEPPSGEGLGLSLEDDTLLQDRAGSESDLETDEEDDFSLEDTGQQPESEPEPEPEPEPAREGPALPSGIFRPGDILGVVDEDLTVPVATDIGKAIGSIAGQRGFSRVAVARDGRFSGPVLLSALIRGLRDSGVDVIETGAVPTPLLWFAATELAEGCGVMVTGSHHPPTYNGFRVMIGGELLDPDEMSDLARRVAQKDFAEGEGVYEQQDILERYGKRLTADIQLERPLKVVVDCGNGVGGSVAPRLLQAIGADLIPLYCDVDGAFPNHRPDPSSPDDLEDLRLCVRNFQAELGIAFDGDADRLALVTRNGEIVWADRLMMLLAEDILSARPGEAVVFDVRCSAHLQRVVEHAGGRGIMTAAGHQPVARRLRQEHAPLGGDMNGHLFINDRWYPFDDAIYAAARLLEILASDTRDVDEILAEQPQFRVSPEIVVDIDRERSLAVVDRLAREADFGDALVTRIDGVRADWPDRWGLARVDADTGRLVLRFSADEATALGRVRSEFRDKLLALDLKLPLPY